MVQIWAGGCQCKRLIPRQSDVLQYNKCEIALRNAPLKRLKDACEVAYRSGHHHYLFYYCYCYKTACVEERELHGHRGIAFNFHSLKFRPWYAYQQSSSPASDLSGCLAYFKHLSEVMLLLLLLRMPLK